MSELVYGDITGVVNRINSRVTTLKTPAEAAWTRDPVDELDKEVPLCLVYPSTQFSSQTQDSPTCRQNIQLNVVCLIVAPVATIYKPLKDIRQALLGWQVSPEYSIMKYTHQNVPFGAPLDIKGTYMWWQDTYEVEFLQRTV